MRGAAAAALKAALTEWRLVALARRLPPISMPGPCSSANCCCCRHCSAASLYRTRHHAEKVGILIAARASTWSSVRPPTN